MIDINFKDDLRKFFKKEWEYQMGSADDFIISFEEFLNEKGYDLSSIIKWNKKITNTNENKNI